MVGRRGFIWLSACTVADLVIGSKLSEFGNIPLAYAETSDHPLQVAVIQPVFTNTAYKSGGFYDWYRKHAGEKSVSDLTGLDMTVSMDWGFSRSLGDAARYTPLLKELDIEPNIVTDIDVHEGKLFENGTPKYSHTIIGHSEYVTQNEYDQLRSFVLNGGNLIFLDGNALYAEVEYYGDNRVRLKKGHAWEVNWETHKAMPSINSRWRKENLEWIGSDYYGGSDKISEGGAIPNSYHPIGAALQHKFGSRVFTGYISRKEDVIIADPSKVETIARFNGHLDVETPNGMFASYTKPYGKGRVSHFGGFGSDWILNDSQVQFLLTSMIDYKRKAAKVKASIWGYQSSGEYGDDAELKSIAKIENISNSKIDISGWKILGGGNSLVTMPNGTVIPSGGCWWRELPNSNGDLNLYDNNLHFVRALESEQLQVVNEDPCA